jgi:DNA-binding transcriptional LysR family regulator
MELRHLKYFCAVAEQRSFSAASRQLNVSQSGVSGQILDLERELGFTLLRRNKREVALTPEGATFYNEARGILDRAARAIEMASKVAKGESGRVAVGLCGPVTAPFLPKLIRAFRKLHPGVTLSLHERHPVEQLDALLNQEIDIGFARGVRPDLKHLIQHELLFREPIVVAIPKCHALASRDRVQIKQLAKEPLLFYFREAAPEIYDAVTTLCQKARFSPLIVDTLRSWQSLLTMVEAEEGIALIPHCVQYLRSNDVVFRRLQDNPCHVDALIAWRANGLTRPQQAFLELVRSKRTEFQTHIDKT